MFKHVVILLVSGFLVGTAAGETRWDLPNIGSPADTVFTRSQAESIGRTVLRQLRQAGAVLEDPEVTEYISDLGQRIVPHAHEGEHRFNFFVVNEDTINAFALPGGFIGINTGLITATRNESELAGVLAHEIAHVTQNHLARRIAGTGKTGLLASAAILAAILLGGGGDLLPAAIVSAQGLAMQEQINYTRAHEFEADRVGLEYLAKAGFDPMGMPSFFEVLMRQAALPGSRVPEFLQTHPLSSTRVAETRDRAERTTVREIRESRSYALMRARIQVINARSADDALAIFEHRLAQPSGITAADYYGMGLALLRAGHYADAVAVLQPLLASEEDMVVFHSALGEALIMSGQQAAGLAVFERATVLFPRNKPLVVRHAEALLRTRNFEQAHAVLLDLFNVVRPTPSQVRLIANAADSAGLGAEALFYLSEYHLLTGDLPMALDKLRQALADPELQSWQRARFEARLAELEPFMARRGSKR